MTVRGIKSGQGRITLYVRIPAKIARKAGIRQGDALKIELENGTIILKKMREVTL